MSIPLVQNNEKDSINTSIIAIKRNIERINMLLGLVDSGSPDLSGFATKQELEDAITQVETDLAPVDEVTSGNMHSVTSNGVYNKVFPKYDTLLSIDSGTTSWTATEDVFCQYIYVGGLVASLTVNNNVVSVSDNANGVYISQFSGFIKKGQFVSSLFQLDLSRTGVIKFFRLY